MSMRSGGHSEPRPPTEEERDFLTSVTVQDLIRTKLEHIGDIPVMSTISSQRVLLLSSLDPVQITRQVVAGTNYHVKYHVVFAQDKEGKEAGGESMKSSSQYIHAKIFQPLPCYPGPPELLGFVNHCTKDEPLVFV